MFRTCEMRPGWVPPILRGGGVLPISDGSPIGTCRFPAASPVIRLTHSTGGSHDYEACGDSPTFTRPAFSSPTTTGWNGSGFGFYPGLHTPQLPTTHAKAETIPWTLDRVTSSPKGTSKQRDHSQRATSRRTPSLVIGAGQFVGASVVGVGDRGQQDNQLAAAVTDSVGHVVFDHSGQVG